MNSLEYHETQMPQESIEETLVTILKLKLAIAYELL